VTRTRQGPIESAKTISVGDFVARFLERNGVASAFGVISIHNMPLLEAIDRHGKLRFVASRGEAGAVNMADAFARVSGGLGVAFTSTGTAAGNACGALIEALTAGSPVLHITGQIETRYLGRDSGYIHEAPAQLEMLNAVSKSAYRIERGEQAATILAQAALEAMTPPKGPVSVEIPIDVQGAALDAETAEQMKPIPFPELPAPDPDLLEGVVRMLVSAKRPMLLLGGGAKDAGEAANALADAGVAIVTTTNGRAIVAEDHPMSLGAYSASQEVQDLYAKSDLVVVAGSRMRSNETWNYSLSFPRNLVMIDINPKASARIYKPKIFLHGDAAQSLRYLADAVAGARTTEPDFASEVSRTRDRIEKRLRAELGPYAAFVEALQRRFPEDGVWVRDVTISNSLWGNKYFRFRGSRNGVHAVGGGIGQGIPMAVGAAVAAGGRTVFALTGDGGLTLCLGELATLADEGENIVVILMNDDGYGVIRNIQEDRYAGRNFYSDILVPDFKYIANSMNIQYLCINDIQSLQYIIDKIPSQGPVLIEIRMDSIGDFTNKFTGPPLR